MNSPHGSASPASHQTPRHRLFVPVVVMLLLGCISAPSQSPAPSPTVMTDYDRFKDETTVGVSATLVSNTVEIPFAEMQEFLTLFAGFTYRGQRLNTLPETVKLAFQSQARSWRFTDAPELYGIVHGERIFFGRMSNSRKDLGAGRIEILRLNVPTSTFLKLARAKTAELRLGGKEVGLTAQHLAALAALADVFTKPSRREQSPAGDSAIGVTTPVAQPQPTLAAAIPAVPTMPELVGSPTKCPIRRAELQPFRGFRLAMTLSEVNERFRGGAPSPLRANGTGIRSMEINLSRQTDVPALTRLNRLEFKFLDDRLYRIEGIYVIGKEWKGRPMIEFAKALSQGLGAAAPWAEGTEKEFSAACGEVRFDLAVDDETFDSTPQSRSTPMAVAFFTVTDVAAEVQIKRRGDAIQRQEKQINAEKRKVFKP